MTVPSGISLSKALGGKREPTLGGTAYQLMPLEYRLSICTNFDDLERP